MNTAAARMMSDSALELVAPYCDIVDRLPAVPPSAHVRGMYFNSIKTVLEREGRLRNYLEFFPSERFSAARMFPLRDYMLRLAVGGACLRTPETLHEGMHEIWRTHATYFAQSLLGKMMLRLLSRDPVRLTEQGLAARRQTFKYGHWSIRRHGDRQVEMCYEQEYLWIESAITGGAVGSYEACGIRASVTTELRDRFNGSTMITW